jgi:hypothetical protein
VSVDAGGGDVLRQFAGFHAAEAAQRRCHRPRRSHQLCGTGVGAEFACREKYMTMMLARMPKTMSQTTTVIV